MSVVVDQQALIALGALAGLLALFGGVPLLIRAIARVFSRRVSKVARQKKRKWRLKWLTRGGKSVAQVTREGYVYVISNPGSFGENVFKVGMTRRDNPMKRVHELGDASVPFYYDVHALIRTDDAPALEARLHRALTAYRVNRSNDKKEFFCLPYVELQSIIKQHVPRVKFRPKKTSGDWRRSKSWNMKRRGLSVI